MWDTVLQVATESGIWAVLFVWLFFKQIKESKVREEKYQETIDNLAEKLKIVAEIKNDVEEIKNSLTTNDFPETKDQ